MNSVHFLLALPNKKKLSVTKKVTTLITKCMIITTIWNEFDQIKMISFNLCNEFEDTGNVLKLSRKCIEAVKKHIECLKKQIHDIIKFFC